MGLSTAKDEIMTLFRNLLPQPASRLPKILHSVPPPRNSTAAHLETERTSLPEVTNAVRELCILLQDYSPSWYSEQHHNRIQQALHQLELLQGSRQDSHHIPAAH